MIELSAVSRRRLLLPLLALLAVAHAVLADDAEPIVLAALVTDPGLAEISGLAASQRNPGLLWVENDSGNSPDVYAIDDKGVRVATVHVDGARNIDWEDLAAFTLGGRRYLLIADTGDNGGRMHDIELYVIEEPAIEARADGKAVELSVKPAWTIEARWPDGARDCEAVAVDATSREVLLMSKRRVPPELFRVRLDPPAAHEGVRIAEQVGRAVTLPQASAEEQAAAKGLARIRHQVTAMDLSPDGRTLAVLTYDNVFLFERGAGARWSEVLQRTPRSIKLPPIAQAEAMGYAADGKAVWVSSEKLPAPLVRIDLGTPAPGPVPGK